MNGDDGRGDRGEPIRVAATVLEILSPPYAVLAVMNRVTYSARGAGEIVIDLGEGPVRVVVERGALTEFAAPRTVFWGELVALHASLAEHAGPNRSVPAEIAILTVGEPIEIYGEVAERRILADGGFREQPSTAIRKIRAWIVCSGPHRVTRMTELIAKRSTP